MAPKGLAGGAEHVVSGVPPRELWISKGERHLPRPAVLGEAGMGELQELAEPPGKSH